MLNQALTCEMCLFSLFFVQSVTAEVWCFGAEAIGTSPCSIARALPELQQVNAAAPAPLTSPIYLQIERSRVWSQSKSQSSRFGWGCKGGACCILQESVSGNLQLHLCSWARCSWPRLAHTPGPNAAGPQKERAACHGEGRG